MRNVIIRHNFAKSLDMRFSEAQMYLIRVVSLLRNKRGRFVQMINEVCLHTNINKVEDGFALLDSLHHSFVFVRVLLQMLD